MGEIMRIRCRRCRKKWQCIAGCGLQHGRKENIIASFQKEEQAQVSEWLGKSRIPLYDFRYQIVPCRFCKSLVSVPVLRGIEDDAIFVGVCPTCKGEIEMPLPEDASGIACPACGNISLTIDEVGHWD